MAKQLNKRGFAQSTALSLLWAAQISRVTLQCELVTRWYGNELTIMEHIQDCSTVILRRSLSMGRRRCGLLKGVKWKADWDRDNNGRRETLKEKKMKTSQRLFGHFTYYAPTHRTPRDRCKSECEEALFILLLLQRVTEDVFALSKVLEAAKKRGRLVEGNCETGRKKWNTDTTDLQCNELKAEFKILESIQSQFVFSQTEKLRLWDRKVFANGQYYQVRRQCP